MVRRKKKLIVVILIFLRFSFQGVKFNVGHVMKPKVSLNSGCQFICVCLDGGLGNQMFQYAFGRTVADRRLCDLILDTSELDSIRTGVTPRSYSLDVFNVRALTKSEKRNDSRLKIRLLKLFPLLSNFLSIKLEPSHDFHHDIACDDSSKIFRGYWQSHHYFAANAQRIFRDFTPSAPLSSQASLLLDEITSANSVMIHVRRGDYVSSKAASAYHSSLSIEYYMSAYDAICRTVEKPHFFVFSDDIEWCREALAFIDKPISFVSPNTLQADWEDLVVMSYCKHHIIANSSFSWWSAWLADQRYGVEERFVSAPLQWFAKDSINPDHRFPTHWMTL